MRRFEESNFYYSDLTFCNIVMVSAVAGVILFYLSNALSASAGLGGGSLNVPIYINVFGFSYHNATILSLCALMGKLYSQFSFHYIHS